MEKKTLNLIEARPKEDVIEHLESLLEQANSGELQGLAYVCTYKANEVSSSWTSFENRMRVIGELEQIKWHLLSLDP